MKLILNLDTWFNIAQVGSSIHGDLLKPNDIDIAICFKLPLLNFKGVKCLRIFKLNLIIIHGVTLEQYIDEFDFGIVRGYRTLFTRKLILNYLAKRDLEAKQITQYERNESLFVNYKGTKEEREILRSKEVLRYLKYKEKIPKGWKLYPLERVIKALGIEEVING